MPTLSEILSGAAKKDERVPNIYPNPNTGVDFSFDDAFQDESEYVQSRFFPDTYLDSPVLVTARTKWLAAMNISTPPSGTDHFSRNFRKIKELLPDMDRYEIVDSAEYPDWFRYPWPSTLTDEVSEAWEIASHIRKGISTAMQSKTGIRLKPNLTEVTDRALFWYDRWSYFDSLIEQYAQVSSEKAPPVARISLGDHTSIVATRDVWFLHFKPTDKKLLLTYDQLLMIKDVMYSRAQVATAIDVFYPGNTELIEAVESLYLWHEECLTRHGNIGFEILKNTEALAKTYLSEMTDKTFGNDGPYPRMVQIVRDKEAPLLKKDQIPMADKFDVILKKCQQIHTVVELFGLLKVSGHPLIDPLIGGLSSAEEAQKPDSTLFHDAEKLNWEFMRCILENYVRKEGKWPDLKFDPQAREMKLVLRNLCQKQVRRLHKTSYPLSDWRYCRFGKIAEFDEAINYLEYIDDKSISAYRTNIAAFWNNKIPQTSHRRLLIELINREEVDVKSIVHAVATRQIPFDWLIVSLHPKEREFKLAPRMFSMLVFEIRIFFAVTEANIADKIFQYIPQQTMTDSQLETSRRFLEITRPRSVDESLRLFIEIDLTRWNLRWRELAIGMIGRTLNDMFGVVGIFDYCHEFFASALIVVRVPGLKPDGIEDEHPPSGPLVWRNHMGGFEGICQKLWTIATVCMVALALDDLPISYTLMGQGDNQVLSILIARNRAQTDEETLVYNRDLIVQRIAESCAKVNQEVKIVECVESTTTISYSKYLWVNGVYYPTTLKFNSRLFPHSAQIFPSVRTNVGAIFSTAMAGAEKSTDPLSSHFLATFHAATYLNRVSKRRGPFGEQMRLIRQNAKAGWRDFVEFTLTLPSECGGYPTIPALGFLYKGGSDPLSKSVSHQTWIGEHAGSRLQNRMLAQLHDIKMYNPTPKLGSLFMDPFSAPFMKAPTAVDGIANDTIEALTNHVRTTDIQQLLSADTRDYVDKLVEILGQCRPMNPLIMRDILDCSVAGITDTVARMFVATRTLQEVVRSLGLPLVDKVLHLEARGMLEMYRRFELLPNNPAPKKTAFELTTWMRERWFPSEVSPLVGITTHQPLDFPIVWDVKPLEIEGINVVLVADDDPFSTRGPYDPYVGSKTREKRSEHGFKIAGTDGASVSMRKLQLISSQIGNDEGMKKIIDGVGWSRTDTTLSEISHLLPGATGGTLSHRYAARAGHQAAYNVGSPNFYTHCVVSTDNTGKLSGGIYDYPLMFQEFLLVLLALVQLKASVSHSRYISVTLITNQNTIDPLPSVDIKSPPEYTLPILRFPTNALTYVQNLRLEQVAGAISHVSLPINDDFTHSPGLVSMGLEAFFDTALRTRSKGRQIADSATRLFQVGTLDLAEVKACGLTAIMRAIARTAAHHAIRDYMLTDSIKRDRWRPEIYAQKLISPMVLTVSPHLGHPLLKSDPVISKFLLYDYPTYSGGYSQAHDRMCGALSEMVLRALSGFDDSFNHHPVGLFTSVSLHATSETLQTALYSDLFVWQKQGHLSAKTVRKIIGTKITPVLRRIHEESERVKFLFRVICNLHDWWVRQGDLLLSSQLDKYIKGQRIKAFRIAVPDLLKSFRVLNLNASVSVFRPVSLIFPANSPPHRQFSDFVIGQVSQGTRTLADTTKTRRLLLTEMFLRNRGRYLYAAGSALYYWIPYSCLIPKNCPAIVIGTGHGAVARVALDSGVPKVYGIDLRSSIPMKAHRFVFYKPPLVNSSEFAEKYEQLSESYTTSGDWTEKAVVDRTLSHDDGSATLIIDIEAGRKRYGLDLLSRVVQVKKAGIIMLRLFLDQGETHQIACDLTASKCEFRCFDSGQRSVSARLWVIYAWGPTLMMTHVGSCDSIAHPAGLAPASSQEYSFQHRSIAIADALLNTVCLTHDTSLQDVSQSLQNILTRSLGNFDSRYSYHEWTRYLRACVYVQWIQLEPEVALATLLDLYEAGETKVRIAGHEIMVKVPWDMCRHMASVCARVLSS
jgi:hypothetical protein